MVATGLLIQIKVGVILKDTFSTFHPVLNFAYFMSVICFSIFFMHPVFLCISFLCAAVYSIYLNGKKAVKFNLLFMIPMFFLVAVVNPVFNHEGATILVYLNDNPITLESIIYGVASSAMFVSVVLWFSCYNAVMSSDKFIHLFGRIVPALSLILSMVLRLIPKYKNQIKVISNAQKCVGRDVSTGNLFQRAKNGINIVSILTTWALENAIDTADSMKSRGYGLKGRTSYSLYRFDSRDKSVLAVMSLLTIIVLTGAMFGEGNIKYFPAILKKEMTPFSIVIYTAYGLLSFLPVIINIGEDMKWRTLQSKI